MTEAESKKTVEVAWSPGLTARAAVDESGLLEAFPEIDREKLVLGIFGHEVPMNRALRAGERVEICRPLIQDPRDMRREAVAEGQVIGLRKDD